MIGSISTDTRQDYKGCVIQAKPRELADGSGWTEGYEIEIHCEDRIEVRPFFSDRKFPSRMQAVASCFSAARRNIDRSLVLRADIIPNASVKVETSSWKNGDLPEELKATWNEEENLRPTVRGDIGPLTGNGVLRYTKDKQRKRLDELDGDPEC